MKFAGMIGFVKTEETAPDVWTEVATEKPFEGDVVSFRGKWQSINGSTNDEVRLNQSISVLIGPDLIDSIGNIRYVRWLGECWKVEDMTPGYPRVILNLGGVWNGPKA